LGTPDSTEVLAGSLGRCRETYSHFGVGTSAQRRERLFVIDVRCFGVAPARLERSSDVIGRCLLSIRKECHYLAGGLARSPGTAASTTALASRTIATSSRSAPASSSARDTAAISLAKVNLDVHQVALAIDALGIQLVVLK